MMNFTSIRKKNAVVFVPKTLFFWMAVLLSVTTSCVCAQTATVVTDMPDYPPGATVNISGYGFQPGETVRLQVVHASTGDNDMSAAHQPWDVVTKEDSTLSTSWFVPADEDELGATLKLTADGLASGMHAEFLFTDAGEILITGYGSAITENFNSLASSLTSSTLPAGWFFSESNSNANGTYSAGNGSSATGDTYSFGATSNSERALGGLRSGSLIPVIGAGYKNNVAGGTITSFNISYNGEQWRLGAASRIDRLDFQYSTNATGINDGAATWTDVDALDFTAPVTAGTVGALDGNSTANRTAKSGTITLSTPLVSGGVIWIRWNDFDATGSDDGLAIDDFSITPVGSVCTVPPTPAITSLNNCNGTATLSTTAAGSLLWSTGAGNSSITVNSGGTYTVTATVDGCTSAAGSITLSSAPPATPAKPAVTITGATTFCTGGSVKLTSSSATQNVWSNGQITQSITVNNSGIYTVSVNNNGCISAASDPVSVTVNASIVASQIVTAPLCAGESGSVQVSATGGTGSYGLTVGTFTVAAGATYSFTVTDGFCSSTVSGTMPAPAAVVANASYAPISCKGGSTTVTISATGGTGSYTGTGTFTQSAGTKSYTVSDGNGCSNDITVTITEPSEITLTESHTDVNCNAGNNGAVDLSVSGGTPYAKLEVSENFNSLASSGTPAWINATTINNWYASVNGATPSSYIPGTGSSTTGAIYSFGTSSADRALGSVASNGTNNILGAWKIDNTTGQTLTSITVTYTGEQWRNGGNTTVQKLAFDYQVNASSISSGTWTPNTALDFSSLINTTSASALDGNLPANRSTLTATFPVTVPAGQSIWLRWTDFNDANNDHGLAIDDLSAVLSSGSATPYTYSWSKAASTIATTQDISSLTAGTYTATVTDANGCTATKVIEIKEPSAISFTATPVQSKCSGEKGSVILSTPTGGTGAISFDATAASGLAEGDYTYTATDANGCTAKQTVHINAAPAAINFTATPVQPKCSGEKGSVILSTPTGGTGTISFDATVTSGLAEGDYTYTATDANGCFAKQTVHINTAPGAISFTATAVQPKCFGEKGSVILSTPTGGTGSINFDATPVSGLGEGDYTYTATDANGCSATQTVHINAAPAAVIATAIVTQPKCAGESGTVTVSATGGNGNYGVTVGTFTVAPGAAYNYTVTDGNGCTSNTVSGTMGAAPAAISFTATPVQPKCAGEKGSVTLSTPTGGSGNITFDATPISGLSAGSYTYTASDANGCTSKQTVVIDAAPSALVASSSAAAILCNGGTSEITVTATGGTAPYTGTGTFTVNAGAYSYTVTDANGCTAITTGNIKQPTALVANCSNNNPVVYFGYTGDQTSTITVSPTGGTAPYKIELTLNRTIKCNQVNDAGDEVWSAAGGTTTGAGCPVYPSTAGSTPLSVKTGVLTGGSYAVTVTLMENAYIIATITDANGCVSTCSTYVHADDVRCFAGNSGNTKVTLCHRTGSSKNPCVTICVDNDAVAEHLAHGDFLGKCTPNCVAPATKPIVPITTPAFAAELTVKVMPNPTPNYFNLAITGKNNNPVTVRVIDIYGRQIQLDQKIAPNTSLRLGQKWAGGTYLVEVMQGDERKVVKVIKAN